MSLRCFGGAARTDRDDTHFFKERDGSREPDRVLIVGVVVRAPRDIDPSGSQRRGDLSRSAEQRRGPGRDRQDIVDQRRLEVHERDRVFVVQFAKPTKNMVEAARSSCFDHLDVEERVTGRRDGDLARSRGLDRRLDAWRRFGGNGIFRVRSALHSDTVGRHIKLGG